MSLRIKLHDIGDIGNVIAALGVIVSLLVVAWEIRGNTKALHADTRLSMVQLNRNTLEWLKDPNFAGLIVRAQGGLDTLTAEEVGQITAFAIGIFDQWEQGYFAHRDGLMEDAIWIGWNDGMTAQTSPNEFRSIWESYRIYYSEEFQAHVATAYAQR